MNEEVPIFCNFQKLHFLSPGYELFFQFRRFTLKVLLLMFVISGIFNLYTNLQGDFCVPISNQTVATNLSDSEDCLWNLSNAISLANKINDFQAISIQQWLNLITVIALIVYFQYFRYNQRNLSIILDENTVSPSDFTFLVSNIPVGNGQQIQEELNYFFKTHGLPCGRELNIQRIVLTYDVSQKVEIEREIERLTMKKLEYQTKNVNGVITLVDNKSLHKKIRSLESRLRDLTEKFAKNASDHFLGTAFITVNTQQELDEVLDYWHLPERKRLFESLREDSRWSFKGQILKVEQADEPNDVYWKNLNISLLSKFVRKSATFIGSVALLVIFFWIILVVHLERRRAYVEALQTRNWVGVIGISCFASVLTLILNFILRQIMMAFARFQRHDTWTNYEISVAKRVCWTQFFNQALTNFTIAVVYDNFWGQGGLMTSIHQFFVANTILSPISQILNLSYYILSIRRKWALKTRKSCCKTQKWANLLFENEPFDFSFRYGYMLKNLYTAAFFAPVFPLALLWTLVGCFFDSIADRYILTKRSGKAKAIGSALAFEMMDQMEYLILVFGMSNLAFEYVLFSKVSEPAVICCIIGLLHIYLPSFWINEMIFGKNKPKFAEKTYEEMKNKFEFDYYHENPATKDSEESCKKLR